MWRRTGGCGGLRQLSEARRFSHDALAGSPGSHRCGPSSFGDWAQAVCVRVCQLLAVGQWFPPGALVSSTSETGIPPSSYI